jgi:hypothetical protein
VTKSYEVSAATLYSVDKLLSPNGREKVISLSQKSWNTVLYESTIGKQVFSLRFTLEIPDTLNVPDSHGQLHRTKIPMYAGPFGLEGTCSVKFNFRDPAFQAGQYQCAIVHSYTEEKSN